MVSGFAQHDDGYEPDELDEDPEGPQDIDLDDDDEETPTDACPGCGREIAHDAQRCPYCREWITFGAPGSSRRNVAFVVVVILVVIALLMWLL